eukprot:5558639-Amphidinium_carterae.1
MPPVHAKRNPLLQSTSPQQGELICNPGCQCQRQVPKPCTLTTMSFSQLVRGALQPWNTCAATHTHTF